MPRDTSHIRKGTFIRGGSGGPVHVVDGPQPLCHVYKQQQQPHVSLDEIGARIEAVRKKVEALRATVKRP